MKKYMSLIIRCILLIVSIFMVNDLCAQENSTPINGRIWNKNTNDPLVGATITVKGERSKTISGELGRFTLSVSTKKPVLQVSHLGFVPTEVSLNLNKDSSDLTIMVDPVSNKLSEVIVSTGYEEIPIERTTGSYTKIDSELLNRSTSTDIISRLEGITSSVHFDHRRSNSDQSSLRIRGLSTIFADKAPLIVVDNFPYEGDINNINPNDVESVTILKDASAASIWGVRAGNGVLVITTKKGQFNKLPSVNFNANWSFSQKPDLYYNPEYLNSGDFIDVETELFNRKYYAENDWTSLSPVIELLIQQREGVISEGLAKERINRLRSVDIRDDADRYLYRDNIDQQYSLNVNGGSSHIHYFISGGLDNSIGERIGDNSKRYTLALNNVYKLSEKLSITHSLNYINKNSQNNGVDMTGVLWGNNRRIYPYAELASNDGSPLALTKNYRESYIQHAEANGLQNWEYKPLEEMLASTNRNNQSDFRTDIGLNYKLIKDFEVDVKYQYQSVNNQLSRLNTADSYEVRNYVNRFTQDDGGSAFPEGSIYYVKNGSVYSHSLRPQLNYSLSKGKSGLRAIAGGEIREIKHNGESFTYYGYDEDILTFVGRIDYQTRYPVLPRGTSQIPLPTAGVSSTIDRFVSTYFNVEYSFDDRYTGSFSFRRDASNLFGVKTNQKGVGLWSVGASWVLSNESFFQFDWLPFMRLRTTYGLNGNIDRSITAFPTVAYSSDRLTGIKQARIVSPGNPALRWETIGLLNVGLDFGLENNRIKGSIEYFHKTGNDLLGDVIVDPTLGYNTGLGTRYRVNYANMINDGVDVNLTIQNLTGEFFWKTNYLFSFTKNKVTHYTGPSSSTGFSSNIGTYPREGMPIEALYSSPWFGLDPQNGDPLVVLNGQTSKNYSEFIRSFSDWDNLIYHGQTVPPLFGSVRNTIEWRKFSLDFNISYKFNYYFKRSSISYRTLINNGEGHQDFIHRWQNAGDENTTQVPSFPSTPLAPNRDAVYLNSELMVERGDHFRLEDIRFGYSFDKSSFPRLPFNTLRLFFYTRNLGFLYRKSKYNLDPDRPNATIIPNKTFSFGLVCDL